MDDCTVHEPERTRIVLAHGAGGLLSRLLEENVLAGPLDGVEPARRHDGAVIEHAGARWALSTDAFTVQPLFFPGGDIGRLAVNGTANDLAMCGARPVALAAAFVLEEGLGLEALGRVVASMREAADALGARVATGDAKVVEGGRGDGLFVTTTGFGEVHAAADIGPWRIGPGDAILVSGDVGRHGLSVLSCRHELGYDIRSDCASVVAPVLGMLDAGIDVHCLRDPTRGGLAGVLATLARAAGATFEIEEERVPVDAAVRDACAFLGLDALSLSNEGRFVAFVAEADADRVVDIAAAIEPARGIVRIGTVTDGPEPLVLMHRRGAATRVLPLRSGHGLPR